MPDDPEILGFSNRWYARGIETAVLHSLTDEMEIKLLPPELFIATKLEAYMGRGGGDLIMSHDIEDILLVVDGREELITEIQNAGKDIRDFIAAQFRKIQQDYEFENFLIGNIRGPEGRVEIVRERFAAISASDGGEYGA